jgi:hypothetical protein
MGFAALGLDSRLAGTEAWDESALLHIRALELLTHSKTLALVERADG